MTNPTDQPDWSLLPARPREFFALPDEFDRKQLKRAYNRLLRLFKPEKHPAEFQQIRGAFEQLDLELRYGRSMEAEQTQAANFQWGKVNEKASQPTAVDENPPRQPLHKRLVQESPKTIYQELSQQEQKDPYDYFALAVLSDVVDRKDSQLFVRWLLRGLKAHPHDRGLLQLMRDYLREVEVSPALVKLLIACSQAVPSDEFFPLTEPAWENLLREHPFESCVETLRQCQSNLRDIGIVGQLVFTIRMLRFAMWRDTTEWKNRAMDFIEENYDYIPGHMEFELEILAAAHRYIEKREQFLNGDSLRYRLDQAMESYFTLDQVEGDRKVLECQLNMLDNSEEILSAFPLEESELCETAYTLWDWLSSDVGDRIGVEAPDELDTNLWLRRCSALLTQCNSHAKNSADGWRWQIAHLGYRLATATIYFFTPVFACLVVTMLSLSFYPKGDSLVILLSMVLLPGVSGIYAAWKLSKLFRKKVWEPYCERKAKRNYQKHWRREVLDFLNRSELPYHYARQLIAHEVIDDMGTWVSHFVQQDCGLAMYSTARRFLV